MTTRAQPPVRTETSLSWAEHTLLLCAALAALTVVSRFVWPLEEFSYLKHLPFALTLPLFVITLLGRHLSAHRADASHRGVMSVAWPLAMLAAVIVIGSTYVRLIDGVQMSFLNMGLYMSLTLIGATIVTRSAAPMQLVRNFCRILFAAAFAMAVGLTFYFGRREVYHEEIFLIIPLGVYGFLVFRHAVARWGSLIFFLGVAFLSAKNTSYLVALMTATYLGMLIWIRGMASAAPLQRVWRYYVMFVVLLLAGCAIALLFAYRDVYLPSGNVGYRGHTYGLAWQRFLDSPVWGTGFAVASVEKFTLFTVGATRNVLPTHSDIMDLLANGGALGIALWAFGLLKIGRCAYRRLLAPRWLSHPWAPYGHTLAAISLAAIATYAFNPIMLQPGMSYLMWISLGFLLGLALRSDAMSVSGEEYATRH